VPDEAARFGESLDQGTGSGALPASCFWEINLFEQFQLAGHDLLSIVRT
jgi:hypothetical protein